MVFVGMKLISLQLRLSLAGERVLSKPKAYELLMCAGTEYELSCLLGESSVVLMVTLNL